MKALFAVLVVLAYVQFSSPACSPDIHMERTNSTIYLCDVNDSNSTFVLSKSPLNTVDWTLEGKRYKVLGSEACLPGQGYTHDGSNFICNPDLSLTADTLGQLLIKCMGTNNLPVYNGTEWICSNDLDVLSVLTCGNGQVVKYINGSWTCANDNDALLQLLVNCTGPFLPVFNNGRISCFATRTNDSDTLTGLIPSCTNGYIPKFINSTWVCAVDNNFLGGFTCPIGTILKRSSNTTWGCGTDFDTFRNLTVTCSGLPAGYDTPILNETGWTCIPVPVFTVSRDVGTVLYYNTYKFDELGFQTDFFVGNYPVRTPYKGSVRAFAVRQINVLGDSALVTASVLINGAVVPESMINRTFTELGNYGVLNLNVPINAGDYVDALVNSTGAINFVATEIYIQLNTTAP
jgi:hypothetical protein